MNASDRWKTIGRNLGFGDSELDAIVREPGRHGDDDYYGAMLKWWLDWAPPKHGYPTLDGLVTAPTSSPLSCIQLMLELLM